MPVSVGYRGYVRGRRPAPIGGIVSGVTYDTSAAAYFAAMSVQPDATRKGLINDLIVGMKADGTWAKSDYLILRAMQTAQQGLINAVTPAQVETVQGTMTFTADRGYMGDGTTGYIPTAVNDNAFSKFSQNSATVAIWINNTGASTNVALGKITGTGLRITPITGASMIARCNGTSPITGAVADGLGLSTAVRSDSLTLTTYRGSTQVATSAANASSALDGEPLQTNRSAATFYPGRQAALCIGSALTSTEVAALNTRLTTYLTAVGGN